MSYIKYCLTLLLLIGCTDHKYSGVVAGEVVRIEFITTTRCPYWEVELSTPSRLGKLTVKSTVKPILTEEWFYVLEWSTVNKLLQCDTYSLRIPWERENKSK